MAGNKRRNTLIITGAGFSIPAAQPATKDILRLAASHTETPLPQIIKELDKYFHHNLKITNGPLVNEDIENLLLKLGPEVYFIPPIFPQTISNPGLTKAVKDFTPALAWQTLFLIYYAMVSDRYEPDLLWEQVDPNYVWDEGMPAMYRDLCQAVPEKTFFLTTNYDETLERALLMSGRKWSYATTALTWARKDWKPPVGPEEAEVIVSKLHGSFRWVQCRDCSRTYALTWWGAHPVGPFIGYTVPEDPAYTHYCWNEDCVYFPLHMIFLTFPRDYNRRQIGVGEPEWIKSYPVNSVALKDQWETAERAADKCMRLVIIGSALRPEDEGLISLIRKAAEQAEIIAVVNPSTEAVEKGREICQSDVQSFDSIEKFTEALRLESW